MNKITYKYYYCIRLWSYWRTKKTIEINRWCKNMWFFLSFTFFRTLKVYNAPAPTRHISGAAPDFYNTAFGRVLYFLHRTLPYNICVVFWRKIEKKTAYFRYLLVFFRATEKKRWPCITFKHSRGSTAITASYIVRSYTLMPNRLGRNAVDDIIVRSK